MKLAVLIPDRGDRPQFLKNCLRMMGGQTLRPSMIHVVDFKPTSDRKDISKRYREGYTVLSGIPDLDLIAFIENDDWYAPWYLETMVAEWEKAGRPDIFGTNYTIYYHLKEKKYFTRRHDQLSSAMSTLIKPNLKLVWPLDHDPYTDVFLWEQAKTGQIKGVVFEPQRIICVGMKHGVRLTGGDYHDNELHRYINDDNGFLENTLDGKSLEFYQSVMK